MENESIFKSTIRSELALREIRFRLNALSALELSKKTKSENSKLSKIEHIMTSFKKFTIWFDEKTKLEIEDKLHRHIENLVRGEPAITGLQGYMNTLFENNKKQFQIYPPSVDKAKESILALIDMNDFDLDQIYDALCLLKDIIPPQTIISIISSWKKEYRSSIEQQNRPIPKEIIDGAENHIIGYQDSLEPISNIFWTSWDFHEEIAKTGARRTG
jgi:hypothetical protein